MHKLYIYLQCAALRTDDILVIDKCDDDVIEVTMRGIQERYEFQFEDESERDEAFGKALKDWGDAYTVEVEPAPSVS